MDVVILEGSIGSGGDSGRTLLLKDRESKDEKSTKLPLEKSVS